MISIDFSLAVSLYLFIIILVINLFWISSKNKKDKDLSLDERFIWFCSVCTYNYVNTREESISTCPRCGSYNKKTTQSINP